MIEQFTEQAGSRGQRHRARSHGKCCPRLLGCFLWLAVSLSVAPAAVWGGGGPESVALIVNQNSWASQTIANYYQDLRQVPRRNVIPIDWKADFHRVPVATFREQLLMPILAQLDKRNLSHVDCVIYSSDFPYEIQFDAEKKPEDKFPSGSLTGMTFLWQLVGNKFPTPVYAESNTNWYAAQGNTISRGSRSFDSAYFWSPTGERVEKPTPNAPAQRYLLSVLLGYTGPRGNTVAEVVRNLQHNAAADGLRPAGTIYYCRNETVRSTTRHKNGEFEQAVTELKRLGVEAQIVDAALPPNAQDVQGAMVGIDVFDWARSGSQLLPGAIAEHLTSFGASFHTPGQTQITEWIRVGAAGTSGTVIEPYALPFKFPHARLHVHYAAGCTLAEAFYQSVNAPYQLLVVGDPLCRPWARIPTVEVVNHDWEVPLSGELIAEPKAHGVDGQLLRKFDTYLDGDLVGSGELGQSFRLVTTNFSDGFHELRVVAVEDSMIETEGRQILPLIFSNQNGVPTAKLNAENGQVDWNSPILIQVELKGAAGFEAYHNQTRVGTLNGESGQLQIQPKLLGSGPVTIDIAAILPGPPLQRNWAKPVRVQVGWPAAEEGAR